VTLTINEVLKATPGAYLPVGHPDTEVTGAGVDSRDVTPGTLFVGIRGEFDDGGQHAPMALRKGAAAAVVAPSAWRWIEGEARGIRKPVIVAPDPLAVLQAAGRLSLERSGAIVVGITGSVGKTTTKDILVAMLCAMGVHAHGSRGNRNTEVGVPMTLMDLPDETEVAVVEMGMRGSGQIAELVGLAPPRVACITSVAPVHLELLGTVEAIAAAKAEILQGLKPGDTAVVPAEDALLAPHLAVLAQGVEVITFGDAPDIAVQSNLTSAWQMRNTAAAVACCRALGYEPPEGLEFTVELSAMRGQEKPLTGGGVLIEDCYNANPLAMRAALTDLAGRPGRRVAVLGDMLELGPDEARFHREVGQLAVELGIDLLVAVGPRAEAYVDGADGMTSAHFPDAPAAAQGLPQLLEPGDVVLLKASRGMALERISAALVPGT
jgi:UDP-N-acetylmuramoyl-tripeptide--D-alanyl-D-alanine ligase